MKQGMNSNPKDMGSSGYDTLLVLILLLFSTVHLTNAKDSITPSQSLKYPDTLVSTNGTFALGFFTPQNSTNQYLGVWYNQVPVKEYVWVANRDKPINDSSGWLRISEDGNLHVLNGRNQSLWTSSVPNPATPSAAQILDSGDFVLLGLGVGPTSSPIIWQSSQHPTDTILPNLKMTVTKNSDARRVLRAWSSPSDPSFGSFSCGADSFLLPQLVIWDGDRKHWRSGPWNGNIFIGIQFDFVDTINAGLVVASDKQGSMTVVYSYPNQTLLSNYKLRHDGVFNQPLWDAATNSWDVTWHMPSTQCDIYGTCGAFGCCNSLRNPMCSCLRGFVPKSREEWADGNWTSGCVRRTQLQCEGDGFLKLSTMKVPDNADWALGLNKDECASQCLKNCSCLAYAFDSGVGCMTWTQSLIDVQEFSTSGVDLYLRLAHSELGSKNKKKTAIAVAVAVSVALVFITLLFLWWWMSQRKGKRDETKKDMPDKTDFKNNAKLEDLPVFEFKDMAIATNNFDESNKLGQGGFGPVYRGKLKDGREIAVKRLSEASGQGSEEFMNEVMVISKLQHRNLVKLLGCCIEGEDKMLIYEYMPNKSLDAFVFDPLKREQLSWQTRFNIIEGICRGILYLHRDSRLRIIHRDLKASNILLDGDLNPKISDFGMARIFGGNQDQDKTRRVVGTYGYMAPEYAMEGRISEKSDVYSFGVLLFEIITGIRNSSFWYDDEELSLLGYAWKLWNEGNIVTLIDERMPDPTLQPEMLRCIHVGLLCVQEFAVDRPAMATVMAMLNGEMADLPRPNQPGFIQRQMSPDAPSSQQQISINYVSFTDVSGR